MTFIKWILFLLFATLQFTLSAQALSKGPSQLQKDQIERGYGMFIHFGINTFNETEWSDGNLPVSSYNPTELDCDQWVKTAKDAGFRYVILVTKHHDGFCLWDSKYTDYDVASSPIKTDVVDEVAKACKKYGLKLGLYYSLWDRHEPSYKDTKKYLKYMKKQLTELMTNYGEVCELWFDGGWDKPDEAWQLSDIYKTVKKMQPECLITVNHTIGKPEDHSAIQNPVAYSKGDPIRYYPVDFRIKDPNLVREDDPKYYEYEGKMHYLPFEHTICLSDRWNWFQKKSILAARPLNELEALFYWGTKNDNILIVNVPPDQHGKIRTHEQLRLLELADRLNIRGGQKPLPAGPLNMTFNRPIKASSSTPTNGAKKANDTSLETFWSASEDTAELEIDFEKNIDFDRISIFEHATMERLKDGFSKIRRFSIQEFELQNEHNGKWDTFYTGGAIGACKTINLPVGIKGDKIRLKIIRATSPPAISHIAVAQQSSIHKREQNHN